MKNTPKPKKCKGTGKAKGFGCSKMTVFRKYGLCKECFADFLFNSEQGKEILLKQTIRIKKQEKKEQRKKDKEIKEEIKNLKELKSDLQILINRIVRLIDTEKGCISCEHGWETPATRRMDAGHYFTVGANGFLRFNVNNIYKQCSVCNIHFSANIPNYRKGIIKIYGAKQLEIIDNLKSKYHNLKFTKDEIRQAHKQALYILRELKKGKDFSREEINKIIGLY